MLITTAPFPLDIFFFPHAATAELYTLSLHDALPFPTAAHFASWARLCPGNHESAGKRQPTTTGRGATWLRATLQEAAWRSEEHTSELQSLRHLVCRLLLEKKKEKESSERKKKTHRSE